MKTITALILCVTCIVSVGLRAAPASADWRVEFEGTEVDAGAQGVTLGVTVAWELPLINLTVPVVVRSLDPGAFWTGDLPVDTCLGEPRSDCLRGVVWQWSSAWANLILELRPGPPGNGCPPDDDSGYDAVSPDHFVVVALGTSPADAQPNGQEILTLTFDVSDVGGQFEFDTACFSSTLSSLSIIDDQFPPVDHGFSASGTGEAVFTKGIVTILPANGILDAEDHVPAQFNLSQNYPNPFNEQTVIDFSLETATHLTLAVYDILGRRVNTLAVGLFPPGVHAVKWNGTDSAGNPVGSGVYFAVLRTSQDNLHKKILLLR